MQKNTWLTDLFWLILFITVLFGFMLGCRALSVPDEGRYTEIPREMLLFHDFITPHLDGVKYFEKPPLLYWIQSGVIALFGIREWALRIPTALMGLLTCLAVYTTGRVLFNRTTGIFSAVILSTSLLFFAMAHSITLDMTVTLWLTVTLLAFIIAVDLPWHSKARRYVCWSMYLAAAFAVMAKGLIGIALPGLIALSWLLIFNRWRELLHLYLPSGLLIFFALALPWHILVQIKNPEFFHFYFVEQHFTRFLTKAMGRYQPMWWFLPVLICGLFPWIVFLPQALIRALKTSWATRHDKHREIFFFLWAIEIFIFFSWSDSKLIPYILPVFPPLALLIGSFLNVAWIERSENPGDPGFSLRSIQATTFSFYCLTIISIILSVALLLVHHWHSFPASALFYLHLMILPLLAMGLGVLVIRPIKLKLIWLTLMQVAFLWMIVAAVPQFDSKPIKALALEIKTLAKPDDIIASYGLYYQDLPVYTQRLVLIVNWKNELTFGSQHQASAKNILINSEAFWKIWDGPQRVFALMDQDDYQRSIQHEKIYLIATHDDDVLVSNRVIASVAKQSRF